MLRTWSIHVRTSERQTSCALSAVVGSFAVVALLVQNATSVALPPNCIQLGEQGLPVPIEYGWPLPCVSGFMTESPGIGLPENYWRSTHFENVSLGSLLINVACIAIVTFAMVRASQVLQQLIRPTITISNLFGLTLFVAVYAAYMFGPELSDVDSDPWRLKIPLWLVSYRMTSFAFRFCEMLTWLGILVSCVCIPRWVSRRFMTRGTAEST